MKINVVQTGSPEMLELHDNKLFTQTQIDEIVRA